MYSSRDIVPNGIRTAGEEQGQVRGMDPRAAAEILTQREDRPRIGQAEIREAMGILQKYKDGKANLESRIVEDELWWELRHWEAMRKSRAKAGKGDPKTPTPTSAWLFNAIVNKHADAMDNFPEPLVLPREQSDDESAKTLSSILPVVMEENGFDSTYSDAWWDKLKHGTAAYSVLWDPSRENGLGDIVISDVDMLKLFWEPGVTDIQDSRNLFCVELIDEDLLDEQYPQYAGKMGGDAVTLAEYCYDDTVDTTTKAMVVDWYYKTKSITGQTLLHYVRFAGDALLYASENDPAYRDSGWYSHGLYPFVFDVLYPEKGTPAGFGYVAVCKDPQLYIDALSADLLAAANQRSKRRYFKGNNTGVNREQFLDLDEPLVDVEGGLDEIHIRPIEVEPIDPQILTMIQHKIEEMKDTASNRDVNSGGAGSGVTAAAAIAALQEAGNKVSRDMIGASYRAYSKIDTMCIELMRQFYDEARAFRVTGKLPGQYDYINFSNANLVDQVTGKDASGIPTYRRPVFDLKISAQKKNPFSRAAQNELAKELYGMGMFNPEAAQAAIGALNMMEFEGKEEAEEYIQQGQTLLNINQQLNMQLDQMAMIIQATTGMPMMGGGAAPAPADGGKKAPTGGGIGQRMAEAQAGSMTGYGERLAKRSVPNMNAGSQAATPKG